MVWLCRVLVVSSLLGAVAGCGKKEEQKAEIVPQNGHGVRKESTVVVPPSVKGQWKAVKIEVSDKDRNNKIVIAVPVGSQVTVPGSSMILKVDTFLPHFTMDGTTLTSQSNEPKNPAAQIRVIEDGKEIYKGWLFSRFPNTHKFEHPKYGFILVDFVPAR